MRLVSRLALLIACCAVAVASWGGAAPADEKKKKKKKVENPLAGRWIGASEEGDITSVSFRITNSGRVLNFSVSPVTLVCETEDSPLTILTTTATLTAAGPVHLSEVVPGFPKGKGFRYSGPGGIPQGDDVTFRGKLTEGPPWGLEGNYFMAQVHSGDQTCRMLRASEEVDGHVSAGLVSWEARKVREKKKGGK